MKRWLSMLLVCAMLLMLLPAMAVPTSAWDGSVKAPSKLTTIDGVYYYEISTAEELAYIAQTGGDWLGYNYKLTNDIVLNEKTLKYDANGNLKVDVSTLRPWTPIYGFNGIFDGAGFSVSGVYVTVESEYAAAGFFGDCYGDVYNLTIKNSYIKGVDEVGGICGTLTKTDADVSKCYFDGAVVGRNSVGGLIGYGHGINLYDCGNYGDVWGTGDYVCGVVGQFFAYGIERCFNEGNIFSTGNFVAGIAGSSETYGIYSCRNSGNVTGGDYVGGICGAIYSANLSGENTGEIRGDQYVGGICGYTLHGYVEAWSSHIYDSYNIGDVYGTSHIGGITGYLNYSDVEACYNVGNVHGETAVGAVVGHSESIWGKGKVEGCYYLKTNIVNATLSGFGNAPDATRVTESRKAAFFPVLLDQNADPSYENLGYKYGANEKIGEGDFDDNGLINMMDALNAFGLYGAGQFPAEKIARMDVNFDGKMDMMDCLLVYRVASGQA